MEPRTRAAPVPAGGASSTPSPRRVDRGLLADLGLAAGGFLLYLAVRWWTLGRTDEAVSNAGDVLALEEVLGLDVEHTVQTATYATAPWLGHAATHVYVWGYFPVLLAATAWLYLRHRDHYRTLRTALVVSGVLGLIVYALYPVAPPWISDDRFADTVADASLDVFVRPGPFMNELGAIPSFHCGWLTLAAVVVFRATRSRALRVLCVALPLAMYVSVVVTGNHWTLDVPAGLAVAALGLFVASRLPAARHTAGDPGPG